MGFNYYANRVREHGRPSGEQFGYRQPTTTLRAIDPEGIVVNRQQDEILRLTEIRQRATRVALRRMQGYSRLTLMYLKKRSDDPLATRKLLDGFWSAVENFSYQLATVSGNTKNAQSIQLRVFQYLGDTLQNLGRIKQNSAEVLAAEIAAAKLTDKYLSTLYGVLPEKSVPNYGGKITEERVRSIHHAVPLLIVLTGEKFDRVFQQLLSGIKESIESDEKKLPAAITVGEIWHHQSPPPFLYDPPNTQPDRSILLDNLLSIVDSIERDKQQLPNDKVSDRQELLSLLDCDETIAFCVFRGEEVIASTFLCKRVKKDLLGVHEARRVLTEEGLLSLRHADLAYVPLMMRRADISNVNCLGYLMSTLHDAGQELQIPRLSAWCSDRSPAQRVFRRVSSMQFAQKSCTLGAGGDGIAATPLIIRCYDDSALRFLSRG